jgi:NAD(P)-dependent dehydrogenase (short-subunit alcohol dehydrogenase family)
MARNVLITGSSSGLGHALALHFAEHGYRVFVGVRKSRDAERLAQEHPAFTPLILDVSRPDQMARVAEQVTEACGTDGLSLLINNAGNGLYVPVEYATPTEVSELFDVVAFAPHRLANLLLPALKRYARGGPPGSPRRAQIFNIISWASLDAMPFVGFYAAAKAAALRISQAQSLELEAFGIDAVAIVPGLMRTPMVQASQATIEGLIGRLSRAGQTGYEKPLAHLSTLSAGAADNPLAAEPTRIARKIFAISQKKKLKEHYYLGWDTLIVRFLTWLPQGLQRRVKRAVSGLEKPRNAGALLPGSA